jgi:uncharacterized protein (DUF2164 family)
MALFAFSKQEKDAIVRKIQQYFSDQMDQEIGQFDAGFLLNFFSEEIGPFFYNKGVQDSQAVLQKRIDGVIEAIDSLQKPVQPRRKTET